MDELVSRETHTNMVRYLNCAGILLVRVQCKMMRRAISDLDNVHQKNVALKCKSRCLMIAYTIEGSVDIVASPVSVAMKQFLRVN